MEKVFCYSCNHYFNYGEGEDCIHPFNVKLEKVCEDTYHSPAQYRDTYILEPKAINKDNQCKWFRKENQWNT